MDHHFRGGDDRNADNGAKISSLEPFKRLPCLAEPVPFTKRAGRDRSRVTRAPRVLAGRFRRCPQQIQGRSSAVQVLVRDNNVDQALKVLKKKMQREGIFREMKLRNHYEKPSEKRAREKAEAVRRARKLARKRAQREGAA